MPLLPIILSRPPSGGQYHIVLADGTKVWLNSASSLKFPTRFSAGSRLVELDGEGYFEVAKDAAHPFKVKIDQMQVEVLGTSFNVMAYQNEGSSKTTLVDGAVKLVNGKNNSLLQPGQQGAVNKETGNFSVVNADLEEVLAWKEGKFRFAGADIQTIMRQIARWYDIAVVYKGALPQKRLSGALFQKTKCSQFIRGAGRRGRCSFRYVRQYGHRHRCLKKIIILFTQYKNRAPCNQQHYSAIKNRGALTCPCDAWLSCEIATGKGSFTINPNKTNL